MTEAASCVVTGGTQAVVGALAEALLELRLQRVGPSEAGEARRLAAQAHGWLHLIPSETGEEREVDLLTWALDEAFEGLSPDSHSSFLALVPADGATSSSTGPSTSLPPPDAARNRPWLPARRWRASGRLARSPTASSFCSRSRRPT